jgi:hypothetical protein
LSDVIVGDRQRRDRAEFQTYAAKSAFIMMDTQGMQVDIQRRLGTKGRAPGAAKAFVVVDNQHKKTRPNLVRPGYLGKLYFF